MPRDNLPLQLTRFVGRTSELAAVADLARCQRLITLTGTGGIGKTRLAIEAALQMRSAFADGVWLIELASLGEPHLVPQAVASPLGVRAHAQAPVEQILLEVLQHRELLLVLDNCEHIIQACAELVHRILRTCRDVHILATSREPLHIPGERTWRVPALSLPRHASPEDVLECEAARLFIDRAEAATGRQIAITEHSARALAHICERLDGIPLAIELAAARAGVLSIEQIAVRLDDCFRLLSGGSRTAAERQQTLRATIDWSYDQLPAREQRLLRQLSVFAGGWRLDAAEKICDGDSGADVLELLAQLVEKSLVLAEPTPGGELRYRLLETVRQYAHEKLNEPIEMSRRHCAYYVAFAEDIESRVLWGPEDVTWGPRLDVEQPNVRAALGWSLAPDGDALAALKLVGHLGHFWYTGGDRGEGRTWLRRALQASAGLDDADPDVGSARAWAILWAGGLAHGQSEYQQAVPLLEGALRRFEQLGDPRGIGWALSFLGHVARARCELEHAVALLERAVAAFRAIDDRLSMISPMSALGFTIGALGDTRRAMSLLEQSVTLARQLGAQGRLAMASLYLGQIAYAAGEIDRATEAWQDALRISHDSGSGWGTAECLEGLALIAATEQRHHKAAHLLGGAAKLRRAAGAPVHPVDQHVHDRAIAALLDALGEPEFTSAWSTGEGMSSETLVDYAFSNADAEPSRSVESDPTQQLTPREREVARLIARGMSNRSIASALVISERTAANHVEHILSKLSFHSRAQVATWATEHGLLALT